MIRSGSGSLATTRFLCDGADIIAELDTSDALLRRYVHGSAVDEPLAWLEGAGTSDRRWLIADQLGSIIAVTNGAGAASSINTYDAFGRPGASNAGRFRRQTGAMKRPIVAETIAASAVSSVAFRHRALQTGWCVSQ